MARRRGRGRAVPTAIAALALLLLPASARAAFAPAVDVSLEPATAGAVPKLVVVVRQAPGETPPARLTVRLPRGFRGNSAYRGAVCDAAAVRARRCPAESWIGMLGLDLAGLPDLGGGLHAAAGGSPVVGFLGPAGGPLDLTVTAAVVPRADGSVELRLAGLPAAPTSLVWLELFGGPRGTLRNPRRCGPALFEVAFTSHRDELAIARRLVEIGGCPLRLSRVRLSRSRFRAVRKRGDRRRRGYGTVVTWRASAQTGATKVRVQRRVRRRWRTLGSVVATGHAGRNVLRFDGRLRRRPLRPGSYRLVLEPRGSEPLAARRFRVLRARRR